MSYSILKLSDVGDPIALPDEDFRKELCNKGKTIHREIGDG